MVASIGSSTVSNWADSVFSRLDTKNQGYIDKADLQDALAKAGGTGKGGGAVNVDDTFSALDGDSDGKVTKSELTAAMTKLSDHLNAQFDASRAGGQGGPGGAGGVHGKQGAHGGQRAGGDGDKDSSGGTSATAGTGSTSADYNAAADTDGDGTVSDAEQAAYDKKKASGQADGASTGQAAHQKDPMRELAHALHLLKAYAETGGSSDASAASATTSTTASSSVNVEA